MFCHKCGRELSDDVLRCPFCNADTSAYLKDDDSSLREILRLSEELNEDSDIATQSLDNDDGTENTEEEQITETEDTVADEKKEPENVVEPKEDEEKTVNIFQENDGFYVPKKAAIKAGMIPQNEPEETQELTEFEGTVELTENINAEQQETVSGEFEEIETIDAPDEQEEEQEYIDETEEFISNYVPVNEVYEEEPEPEEEMNADVDYADGFVDNGYSVENDDSNDDEYYGEYEEEEFPETPAKKKFKKKFIVIPLIVIIVAAAGLFGLSEFVINSSASKAIEAFTEQKYDTAAKIYNENVKNSPIQMWLFEGKMNEYIDSVVQDHRDKVLTYDDVKKALNSVIALDDDRFSQKAKDALETVAALEVSRAAFSAGQKYFNSGDYIAAAKEFDKVIESDPDYSKAVASRDRSYEKYKEDIMSRTSGCETVEEYTAAIELLNEAVKNMPNDTELKSRLDRYKKDLEEAIISQAVDSINELVNSGSYQEALALIDETLEKYPENEKLLELKTTCTESYISSSIENARQLLASEEYMEAIGLINSMLDQFPDNEALTAAKDECINTYVNVAVSSADEFVNAGNYETALEVINKALSDLPGNQTLLNKKQEIETNMPVSLMEECPPYDGTNLKTFTNSSTSSFKIDGKTYREGFTLYSSNGWFASGNGIANMNIGGSYSRLTFNAGKVDGGKSVNGILKVYIDGELVDTLRISGDGGIQSYEISLNYGSSLKFELSPESGSSTPTYGFTNLTLYK